MLARLPEKSLPLHPNMCRISIDTVRRANSRTIRQVGGNFSGGQSSRDGFDVSVSILGKTYTGRVSQSQIRKNKLQRLVNDW